MHTENKTMATPTQEQILDALQKCETNLCAWAKAHNYKYTTVFNTVLRWAGRDDRSPHGGIARHIMSDLSKYVDQVATFEEQGSNQKVATDKTVATFENHVKSGS
jgi:hypothetical protein